MEYIQIEINNHKTKLLSLINNLINTQLINEEIFINNEIKKESECLISLLNVKQNTIMNQNNIIFNNVNFNPLLFHQNQMVDQSPKINVKFEDLSRKVTNIICKTNEPISNEINKYREKANDYNENRFIFNGKDLDPSKTLYDFGILTDSKITVSKYNLLNGSKNDRILI